MAGGIRLITMPSVPASASWARRASSAVVAPSRRSQGFMLVKAIAAFGPEPEKPKPSTAMLLAMSGRVARWRS